MVHLSKRHRTSTTTGGGNNAVNPKIYTRTIAFSDNRKHNPGRWGSRCDGCPEPHPPAGFGLSRLCQVCELSSDLILISELAVHGYAVEIGWLLIMMSHRIPLARIAMCAAVLTAVCASASNIHASIMVTDPSHFAAYAHDLGQGGGVPLAEVKTALRGDDHLEGHMSPQATPSSSTGSVAAALLGSPEVCEVLVVWRPLFETPNEFYLVAWRFFRPPRSAC